MHAADASPGGVSKAVATLLQDTMPFYVVDRGGTLLYGNREYGRLCEAVGAPDGLIPGIPLADIIRELEAGAAAVQQELTIGEAAPVTLQTRHAAIRDDGGELVGIAGNLVEIARDVTGAAEAAREAAESRARLIEAIESISEGFALFDADDRLVLCNSKYRSILPRTDISPGRRFEDIVRDAIGHGDLVPGAEDAEAWIASRIETRRQPGALLEMQLGDGRWIQSSDRKTSDGSTVGVRTDITEMKRREEALYHAKEMAEIASRSKSDFLANISHELRTPLNAIIGFSEVMREGIFGPIGSEQYQEYLGDILDIAKAEAGKLELTEENIDVARVIRAAARLVRERAHRGGLTLDLALPASLPMVFADERKLKQILLNLLTNAVKFTPAGGRITVTAEIEATGALAVAVADTGIGIAPEHIATAMTPFGQVDGSLNRKYDGTGLGLPLSRAMAQLHGGDITIESEVGSGTIVTLVLPADRIQSRSAPASTAA